MAGPALPHVPVTQSILAQTAPGGDAKQQMVAGVGTMLAEQTLAYEKAVKPELAAFEKRLDAVMPKLLEAADLNAAELEEEIAKIDGVPAEEREQAISRFGKTHRAQFAKAAEAVGLPPNAKPGSVTPLIGPGPPDPGLHVDWAALAAFEHLYLPRRPQGPTCVDQTLRAPYPIFGSTNIDTANQWPDAMDPNTGVFLMSLFSGVVGWPHKAVVLGSNFAVRDNDTHVTVTATVGRPPGRGGWASIAGLGYIHVWSQLIFTVGDGTTQVAAVPVMEHINASLECGDDWLGSSEPDTES